MKLIRELWYILSRREKIEGSILLCSMALGALFEAVGIGLIVPFIAILKDPELMVKFSAARMLFSFLNIHEPQQMLIAAGVGLIGIFVIKSGYLVLLYRWLFRYAFGMQIRLARHLLTGYLNAPYTFHLQRNSAELIKAMTESVQSFTSGFLVTLLTILVELLVVAALIILLMLVESFVTLGAVLVLAVPTALSYWAMRRRLAISGRLAE
ncbi:MAG: hypothetical protein ACREV8_01325, partial [Gammaproteobacteria bacterium]